MAKIWFPRPMHFLIIPLITVALGFRQASEQMPKVIESSAPEYPRVARVMHIYGTVQLKVTTDGNTATDIIILSGPAMLALAAEKNVKTWKFERHNPVTFVTTFRFILGDAATCGKEEEPTVVEHLPSEAQIVGASYPCEPPARDPTKPITIALTVQHNGRVAPPPKEVILTLNGHSTRLPVENGKFAVAPDLWRAQSGDFDFTAKMNGYKVEFEEPATALQVESWTIITADRHFPKEYDYIFSEKRYTIASTCVIEFDSQYMDPGTISAIENCRTKIKEK